MSTNRFYILVPESTKITALTCDIFLPSANQRKGILPFRGLNLVAIVFIYQNMQYLAQKYFLVLDMVEIFRPEVKEGEKLFIKDLIKFNNRNL